MAKKSFNIDSTRGVLDELTSPAEVAPTQVPAASENSTAAPGGTAADSLPAANRTATRYDQLARKDARLREDQIDDVAELTRAVNRAAKQQRKPGQRGERITENTMLRVAVDLLLSKRDKLRGTTEDELRRSVGVR